MSTFFCRFCNIFLCLLLVTLHFSCNRESQESKEKLPRLAGISPASIDLSKVKPGDFVLKRGMGPISKMITDNFKEEVPISHCGIFVVEGDSLEIIHSVTQDFSDQDGVQRININRFLLDCTKDFLYSVRYKSSPGRNEKMAKRAIHYANQKIGFDKEGKNENTDKMSCTELLFWCMKDVYEVDVFNRIKISDHEFLGFSGLLDTAHFEIIARY